MNRWRPPSRDAMELARALLMDVASRDPEGPLARGLERFGSWRSLAAITSTDWLPLSRRVTTNGWRAARRSLRILGGPPASLPAAAAEGGPVQLRGVCAPLPEQPPGDLWQTRNLVDDDGRWVIEEGRDFILHGDEGAAVLVLAEGGRLVNAERLRVGDAVAVFGELDEAPAEIGLGGGRGRGGWVSALRSGPTHPLLVSVIRRYDQQEDGPQS